MNSRLYKQSLRAVGRRTVALRSGAVLAWLVAVPFLFGSASEAAVPHPQPTSQVVALATSFPAAQLQEAFDTTASRWGVPVELLMAVGYVESRWEQRAGEASIDGGYGIMHLVDGEAGTLQKAAKLTGLTASALKADAVSNIEGGAALLSYISQELKTPTESPNKSAGWFEVAAAYSGSQDAWVRDEYAREVFRVLGDGATVQLTSGETLTLAPSNGVETPARNAAVQAPNSEDYPDANWVPAHSNNYTAGRPWSQSSGLCSSIKYFVIHDTEGSYNSAINWFQNSGSGVSAHYVLRSSDGHMTQMVRNADTGHHAGSWKYNICSIGIEHEGYMNQNGWYTEAMYQASAKLVATMSDRYGIKKDRSRVIAHSEVPGATHQDPGPKWDWDYYMGLVRGDSRRAGLVDNTDSGFSASPSQLDSDHAWWTYGNGHAGSSTLSTRSVTSQQSSENSGTWTAYLPNTGYYDLYAFVPYVDNNTPDTDNARYNVYASDGTKVAAVSQKAITDRGVGGWAHLGKFHFNAWAEAKVYLDDYTGESGRNVWYDAMMWIPANGTAPPPPPPPAATSTPYRPPATATNTRVPTKTSTPVPTWTPGPCNMRFYDLPDTSWAYSYISNLYCRNVVSGFPDGTFRPNADITRGQFTKMLVLGFDMAGQVPSQATFSDVPLGSTYSAFVETAAGAGIVGGYPDGTFRPNEPVTRGQAVKMITVAANWGQAYPPVATFADIPSSHWAFGYVESAYRQGIINGYPDGTFRPQVGMTRAQVSKVLTIATQPWLPRSKPDEPPVAVTSPTSIPLTRK
ncbi:MAG: S-layer homology domain-containing protein [Chloroflexota bacterium]|nr:S-layer homology domain-containing protein [Chloroflexota bacterium]